MSKGIEEMPEKKINLSNMSERQALLYFQNGGGNEDLSLENPNSLLDYHQYFNFKQEIKHSQCEKTITTERSKNVKLALKEFTSIKKNIYIDRKKYVFTDDEAYICTCFPRKYTQTEAKKILESGYTNKTEEELFGCGRSCINKMVYWECVEHLCPCGASCRNRKFQNHEYADVYPTKTEDRGFGLCAGTLLPQGSFVMQYIGEVYSADSDYGQKKLEEYKNKTCTYLMSLSKNEVIDPTSKGNYARFINHSCEPNCETQKWHVLGEVCVGIFTLRDIQPDEELTFNYGFNVLRTTFQKCLCGANNCRGYLGIVSADSPKNGINSITCEACKNNCKQSDPLLVCDYCRKIYHKKCDKKGKGNNRNYTCYHCLKKDLCKRTNIKEKIIKIEEEPVYDENYEVGDEEIGKIRQNLSELINCGARLFWDFQMQNAILGTSNKLDIKITGTSTQIENVKKMIKQLKEMKSDLNYSFIVKLQIPKVFVRKIIGHQNRNLNAYKSKFNVEINYDASLITDDIFPIQDYSYIQIKGKENNVKAVENDIKSYLYHLRVLSIFLMPNDYSFIKGDICNLKTIIDPADVRLRKQNHKNEKDLKHPFYYIANNTRDIVIIGFDREVEKAEKIVKDFILRQNTLVHNYSLSFLYPIYFRKQFNNFIDNNQNQMKDKNIYVNLIEPEYLRRHLCVYLEGKWKDITDIKSALWKYLKESPDEGSISLNGKKHSIGEFEQYAFNQEHKLISKTIKNNILDSTYQIKNWDYISVDVRDLVIVKNKNESNSLQNVMKQTFQKKKESSLLLKQFPTTCDRDTKLNYLTNFPPGSYKTIFNQTQNEVASNLLSLVTEAFDSYKEGKLKAQSIYVSESKKTSSVNKPQSVQIEERSAHFMINEENKSKNWHEHEHVLIEQLKGVSKEHEETNLKHFNSSLSLNPDNDCSLTSVTKKESLIKPNTQPEPILTKVEKEIKTEKQSEVIDSKNDTQNLNQCINKNHNEPMTLINQITPKEKTKDNSNEDNKRRSTKKTETNNKTNSCSLSPSSNENDSLKFSYSFPTIQQMNININISDINFYNKQDKSIETDNIPNYIQQIDILTLKQKKSLYSFTNKISSSVTNASNYGFNSDSVFLQRKTKRSLSSGKRSLDKSLNNYHQYPYNSSKDNSKSYYADYAYKKRTESPIHHIKRCEYASSIDRQTHSRSPSLSSYLNNNNHSSYHENKYKNNYYSNNSQYNPTGYPYGNEKMSNYNSNHQNEYNIDSYSDKQYYSQRYDSYCKRGQNEEKNYDNCRRYNEIREKDQERDRGKGKNRKKNRERLRDKERNKERNNRGKDHESNQRYDYSNSNQLHRSRSRSRSNKKEYGSYSFKRSSPEYNNYNINKNDQNRTISAYKDLLNLNRQTYPIIDTD